MKLDAWLMMSDWLVQNNRYIVTLCDRKIHVTKLCEACNHPYMNASGSVERKARIIAKDTFDTGDVQHIITSRVFKKGVTIKRVDTMFDVAEFGSRNDAVQKFGRGIGLFDSKTELIYIDFGTQGLNKMGENARSRVTAFKRAGIPVTRVMVKTPLEALEALKKFMAADTAIQEKLPLTSGAGK
jgi:superfamily II DNA or RNA helicase